MAPRKASATRSKKAAGLAQPVLSFQQRKPSAGGKKAKQTPSTISIPRTESATSVKASEAADEPEKGVRKGRRQLDPRSKEWSKLKRDAETEMGGMKPIHAGPDTHNDIHHILRVFDLTSTYGPCVGVTRLQRWERAKKWGLNPPEEIKAILTTEQGEDEQVYRENVLYTWLG